MGGEEPFKVHLKVLQIEMKPIRELVGLQKVYVRFSSGDTGFKEIKPVRISRDGIMNFKRNNVMSVALDPAEFHKEACKVEVHGIFASAEKNGAMFSTTFPVVACHVNSKIKIKFQLVRAIQTNCTGNITVEVALGANPKPFDKFPYTDIDLEAVKNFEKEKKARKEAEEREEESSTGGYSSNRTTRKPRTSTCGTKNISSIAEKDEQEVFAKIKKALEPLPIEILDFLEKNQTIINGCVEDYVSQENDMNIF